MSACVDCGHSFDAHGPVGCIVITIDATRAREAPCPCTTPGRQEALFEIGRES